MRSKIILTCVSETFWYYYSFSVQKYVKSVTDFIKSTGKIVPKSVNLRKAAGTNVPTLTP